jgi:hypothetical protein
MLGPTMQKNATANDLFDSLDIHPSPTKWNLSPFDVSDSYDVAAC